MRHTSSVFPNLGILSPSFVLTMSSIRSSDIDSVGELNVNLGVVTKIMLLVLGVCVAIHLPK